MGNTNAASLTGHLMGSVGNTCISGPPKQRGRHYRCVFSGLLVPLDPVRAAPDRWGRHYRCVFSGLLVPLIRP